MAETESFVNSIRTQDILIMTATVYGEARGTDQPDREAVAMVIMNRWKHGPDWMKSQRNDGVPDFTIEAVCLDPWQFSCWNQNDPNRRKLLKILKDPVKAFENSSWRSSMEAVLRVVGGRNINKIGKSLHYHAKSLDFPSSWGDKVNPKYASSAHLFYEGIE